MDPLTMSLIIGAGISLVNTGVQAGMASKKSPFEKQMEERLASLNRKMASGQLGLSKKEKEELLATGNAQAQAAERELQSRQAEVAALSGASGGQVQKQALAAQQMKVEAQAKSAAQVNELDRQKRLQQEAEVKDVESTLGQIQMQRKAQMAQAIGQGTSDLAGLAGSFAVSQAPQQVTAEDIERYLAQQKVS